VANSDVNCATMGQLMLVTEPTMGLQLILLGELNILNSPRIPPNDFSGLGRKSHFS